MSAIIPLNLIVAHGHRRHYDDAGRKREAAIPSEKVASAIIEEPEATRASRVAGFSILAATASVIALGTTFIVKLLKNR